MNTKLSGCKLVFVPITKVGINKFPFIEDIRGRVIKYIDLHAGTYLPNTTTHGDVATTNMYVTIMDEFGNTQIHNHIPLERLDYVATQGIRVAIGDKISLNECYVDCKNAANVGKIAAFVLWYDLPEFSKRNSSDSLITDYLSIPLTTTVRYNTLPDEDRMVGKRFRRILAATPAVTPDFQDGVTAARLPNLYLTLRKGSYNVIQDLPLSMLVQLNMQDKTTFQNIIFDLQSSYITIGGQGTIPGVTTDYIGKYVFLNMQYEAK